MFLSHRLTLALILPSFCLSFSNAPSFRIETFAGTDLPANALLATSSIFEDARAVAVDRNGNVYLSDTARHRVFRMQPAGQISLVAGAGRAGFAGDGGPAEAALLNEPYGLAVDTGGNLYIADLGNGRVRRVAPDGRIRTVAGGGSLNVAASGIAATDAALRSPRNLAVDQQGWLYVSEFTGHRILRISPDGRLQAVGGTGAAGSPTASAPALLATLNHPAGIAIDSTGALVVADSGNHVLRRIQGGVMTTLQIQNSGALIHLPVGVSADASGSLFVVSAGNEQLIRVSTAGASTLLADGVRDAVTDAGGNVYFTTRSFVRRIDTDGQIRTLAGTISRFRGEAAPAADALLFSPSDIKPDPSGGWIIADSRNHRIRRISPAGLISTIAGDGEPGFRGDRAPAIAARLHTPQAVVWDRTGNLYIADTENHRVRRIGADGLMQTIAGTGVAGNNGDVRPALEMQLSSPSGLAVDDAGNLHISDTGNHRVCRFLPGGFLLTIAGRGLKGFGGDGFGAMGALLDTPRGLAFDAAGNLYVADSGNHRIRRIAAGLITTFAGAGTPIFSGDGRQASEAGLNQPWGLYAGLDAAIYLTDAGNSRIRLISADGIIRTIAGAGTRGFAGDGGSAIEAQLDSPAGLAPDSSGNLFFADRMNHRIRKLAPVTAVDPHVTPMPELRVIHSARLEPTAVAPGMLLTVQGSAIGPSSPVSGALSASGALESLLAGVEVRLNAHPAPILYGQENLINIQAPYTLIGQTVVVEVIREGRARGRVSLPVAATAPGIFTVNGGAGPVAALNADFSLNSATNPAARGSRLTLFATGEGMASTSLAEGRVADSPYPSPAAPIQLLIGGRPAEVVNAAVAITSPGVVQLTAQIPADVPPGSQPLLLIAGGVSSQPNVTVFLK